MKPFLFALAALTAMPAAADPPQIDGVSAVRAASGWRFDVTLSHPDTGWDHYADGWRVLAPDGTEIGMRVLHHPHVDEQPFTRSLSRIDIPGDLQSVVIEARCSVDGWSTRKTVDLPR